MQSQTISQVRTAGRGIGMIGAAAILWGTVGVTTQALYDVSETNALSIGFFRLAISSPILLLTCWLVLGRTMFRITRRDWWMFLALGALTATYQVCLFSAIRFVGVSIAVVVTLCIAPLFVALASIWLFGERLTRWTLAALGLALVGTLLLSGGGAGLNATTGATIIGVALALGSAIGYGSIALISRTLAPHYHPLQPLAFGFTAGAIMLLPIALAQGLVISYSPVGWALLLHMGLLPTALAYVLFFFGMRSVSATSASIITLVEPLTAALLAWLLFGEWLGATGLIGGALLLGAILVLYQNEARR